MKNLIEYIRENADIGDVELENALDKIDKYRAPLQVVDEYLFSKIQNAIEDYIGDLDVEEVFYELIK
jgi:hypothetical protein